MLLRGGMWAPPRLPCCACGGRDVGVALVCVNARCSIRGRPPCASAYHPACFCGGDGFHSIRDPGDDGLHLRTSHTALRFVCELCRLEHAMGRVFRREGDLLRACARQALIDALHVVNSGGADDNAAYIAAINRWLPDAAALTAPSAPGVDDVPSASFMLATFMVYVTSAHHRGGRRSGGRGVVFATARKYRTAVNWLMRGHSDDDGDSAASADAGPASNFAARARAQRAGSFAFGSWFRCFVCGLRKRIGDVAIPAVALPFAVVRDWINLLTAQLDDPQLPGTRRFDALQELLLLCLQFFLVARGGELFRLRTGDWRAGLFCTPAARMRGVVPHIRVAFRPPTKTRNSEWWEGVLAPRTASGVELAAICMRYDAAIALRRQRDDAPLFTRRDGRLWVTAEFTQLLRRRLGELRDRGAASLIGLSDADIASRYDLWSLRRGAETWMATDLPGKPAIDERLGDAHAGWRARDRPQRVVSALYNSAEIETRITATARYM